MARVLDTTTPTPFIGRIRELAQIRQALDRARDGSGSVVLVTGEPGIGKTRLVEEAVGGHTGPRYAHAAGFGSVQELPVEDPQFRLYRLDD